MHQLLPCAIDRVDPGLLYADLPIAFGRPTVRLSMITSIDGASAIAGRSGGLGGSADRHVFSVLRSVADVVLVGAGTIRAEGYGPATVPLAVVTRTCDLDLNAPLFTATMVRPLVITVARADAGRRKRASEVAEVVVAGDADVDLRRALGQLRMRGYRSVLAEGGPTLNAQLVAAGLVDELCLTLSPRLVAGVGPRIVAGVDLPMPTEMIPVSVCEEDGFLFLRLRPIARSDADSGVAAALRGAVR
jgi:riboflavin biosynthesis pyrimidine reductase